MRACACLFKSEIARLVDMGAEDDATFQRAVEDALAQLGGDVDTVVLNHVGSSGNYLQEVRRKDVE